ncbi:hypothetical protein HELRODRAFT_159391 [Helobdella robusta]|uniref:DH domain-containing protein n=1 Tax=Helobdella robusta TaxID=6412 RepID=T1ENZ7_HELRO|nr:hypothetical protein HELRODRAFT_159391 [Helobdella robusta]ESO12807.1 hypothetical protein HELRODRAFT_159391 [Helobdella robusta]
MEIYETEKKYCSSLWILLDHFAGSLRRSRLVSGDVVSLMFSPCLEEIYKDHCQFLHQLDIQLINWNPHDTTTNNSGVIDIFREFFKSSDCPLLRQYQAYVTGFSASLLKIRKVIKENDDVATLFKVLQGDACCDRLDLNAFLLTPVQRIPRYVLLFKQLLKYTDQRSEEWTLINTCLTDLANFLNCLNGSIEQSLKLVSIKSSMKPKKKFGISLKSNAQQQNGEKMFRQLSTGHQRNNLQYEQPQHNTLPSSSNSQKSTPLRSKMKLNKHSKRESKAYDNMGLVDEDVLNGTLVRSELETEAPDCGVVEPSTQTIELFQNIIRFSSDDEDQLKRRFSTTFSKFENKITSLAARRKKKSNKTGPLVASHNISGFTGIKDENSNEKFDEVVVANLDDVDGDVREVELCRERKGECQKTFELSANSTAKPESGAIVRKNSSIGGRILKKFKPSFEKENSTLQQRESEQQPQQLLQQAASATLFASNYQETNTSILSKESIKRKSIKESAEFTEETDLVQIVQIMKK